MDTSFHIFHTAASVLSSWHFISVYPNKLRNTTAKRTQQQPRKEICIVLPSSMEPDWNALQSQLSCLVQQIYMYVADPQAQTVLYHKKNLNLI